MLVIADAECAEDIGGVMGGANSKSPARTRRDRVRGGVVQAAVGSIDEQALGLKTEASMRFERGADRPAPPRAMARALELLERSARRRPRGRSPTSTRTPYQPRSCGSRARIARTARHDVPDAEVDAHPDVARFRGANVGGRR